MTGYLFNVIYSHCDIYSKYVEVTGICNAQQSVYCMYLHCISFDQPVNYIVFQCPCFYVLSKKSLPLLDTFSEEKKVNLIVKNPDYDVN